MAAAAERDDNAAGRQTGLWWVVALLALETLAAVVVSSGDLRTGCTGAGGERDDVCPDDPGRLTTYLPWAGLALAATVLLTGFALRRRYAAAPAVGVVLNIALFLVFARVAHVSAIVV